MFVKILNFNVSITNNGNVISARKNNVQSCSTALIDPINMVWSYWGRCDLNDIIGCVIRVTIDEHLTQYSDFATVEDIPIVYIFFLLYIW